MSSFPSPFASCKLMPILTKEHVENHSETQKIKSLPESIWLSSAARLKTNMEIMKPRTNLGNLSQISAK